MIVRIGGGEGGFKDYLETGQKKGRELHRDQLDQRVPLFGDLNVFEIATTSHEGDGQRYDHITLSFPEHHVSDEILQEAVFEFRDHALAAWPEEQRHRVAFYAEAHRPKVLSYVNYETGEQMDRLTHIHIGIGRRDLATGKAIEVLGYLGPESDNLKYIDAWQESFNARHGFSSPKDNPKITPENAVDTLARYTGARPDSLGTFSQRKSELEISLQKEILAKNITSWANFGELLDAYGVVSKMHKGKFNECYRVKLHGYPKSMRLSGIFFQREFIERPTSEKQSIISRKAEVAYLEQMRPRKVPEYLDAVLKEWRTLKAREQRFLHTGSKYYKEVYKPEDTATRLQLLDQLEREHNDQPRTVSTIDRKETASPRNRLPGMRIRDLDGVQARTEMLLRDNDGLVIRTDPARGEDRVGLRQTASGRRNGSGRVAAVQQPSSVIDRVVADQRDRYEQANDKDRFAEIRKYLDCTQLLSTLSHTHGLNPELYPVHSTKDGTPRIQCGSRSLTPNDFLTKELGLPWNEAAPILRNCYEQQIVSKVTQPLRLKSSPPRLWQEFKAERSSSKAELSKRLQEFSVLAKARRLSLSDRLKDEQKSALVGLSTLERKAANSLQKLRMATERAELSSVLKEERKQLQDSFQPPHAQAWRSFIQRCAQLGDEEALTVLRKLDDTARSKHISTPSFTGYLDDTDIRKRPKLVALVILKSMTHDIESNGCVLYKQNGREILRDEGRHLAVLDENSDEAILAGLLIAREKFNGHLYLTGSPEFQRRAISLAVANGVQVKFIDPQQEELRLQIVRNGRKELSSIPNEQPNTTEQQEPPKTAPVSAIQWAEDYAKANGKDLSDPQSGSENVTFEVIHRGKDGVVLNLGRKIAVYPPTDLDINAGDRVLIGRSMEILLQQKSLPVQEQER
jgi:hypothetical protein